MIGLATFPMAANQPWPVLNVFVISADGVAVLTGVSRVALGAGGTSIVSTRENSPRPVVNGATRQKYFPGARFETLYSWPQTTRSKIMSVNAAFAANCRRYRETSGCASHRKVTDAPARSCGLFPLSAADCACSWIEANTQPPRIAAASSKARG